MIKVSIITPVYNVEECIERSIKSIINQTNKDFELLLIDDGSKDRSIEIAKSLLQDSNIKYKIITQENSGVSAARNRGIEEASGEYITFLDSDDYIDSRFIEFMYDKAATFKYDLVFCDYAQVDSKGDILVQSTTRFLEQDINGREAALKQLNCDITIGMGSALYKTSIVKKNNLFFDGNRKYAEDNVFTVKALLKMNRIVSVNKVLMYYVRWDSSVTKSVSLNHLDCYYSYVDLLEYLDSEDDLQNIKLFLIEYKIPYAIAHIFSVFSKDRNFHEELLNFLAKDDVKKYLRNYKIQKMDKNNIRYFIQCKGIKYCPKILIRIFNKIKY